MPDIPDFGKLLHKIDGAEPAFPKYGYLNPEEEFQRLQAESYRRGSRVPARTQVAACDWSLVEELIARVERCAESPIERMFGISAAIEIARFSLDLVPQYKLERFRFDFAVLTPNTNRLVALIECDGEQFHSDPRQQEIDNRKTDLAHRTCPIFFRFRGAEIYADPRWCSGRMMAEIRILASKGNLGPPSSIG